MADLFEQSRWINSILFGRNDRSFDNHLNSYFEPIRCSAGCGWLHVLFY